MSIWIYHIDIVCMCVVEHLGRVDADPHEVALWVLLKRTRSNNRSVRLQALQDLAGNHHWQGEQAHSHRTAS